jgi:hypothetical protein
VAALVICGGNRQFLSYVTGGLAYGKVDLAGTRSLSWRKGRSSDDQLRALGYRSLISLCKFCQALRGDVRAKFRGLLVPLAGLGNIGLDADSAGLMQDKWIKRPA